MLSSVFSQVCLLVVFSCFHWRLEKEFPSFVFSLFFLFFYSSPGPIFLLLILLRSRLHRPNEHARVTLIFWFSWRDEIESLAGVGNKISIRSHFALRAQIKKITSSPFEDKTERIRVYILT